MSFKYDTFCWIALIHTYTGIGESIPVKFYFRLLSMPLGGLIYRREPVLTVRK